MVNKSWNARPDVATDRQNVVVKEVANEKNVQGMFAQRKLNPSDIVCSVGQPLLLALDTARLNDTCYNCHTQPQEIATSEPRDDLARHDKGNIQSNLKACSGCKTVKYCSRQCQKVSWREVHKLECDAFRLAYPRIMPHSMRAVFRLIKMKEQNLITTEQWNQVMQCQSHVDEISSRKDEEFVKMVQMACTTIELAKTKLTFQSVLQLYCTLKINAITLMTSTFDPIGLCMHPLIAKINHSCNPNSYIRFTTPSNNDIGIEVTPLREIAVDEEITISYVDENKPLQMRRDELSDRYFFHCQCLRCKENDTNNATTTSFSSNQKTALAEAEAYMKAADTSEHPSRTLEQALKLLDQHTWDRAIYPYPQILQRLIVSYIDEGEFSLAMGYAAIQALEIDDLVYTVPFHPIRLVHLYVLLRLVTAVALHDGDKSSKLDLQRYEILSDLGQWRADLASRLRTQSAFTYGRLDVRMPIFPDAYDLSLEKIDEAMRDARESRMQDFIAAMYARLQQVT